MRIKNVVPARPVPVIIIFSGFSVVADGAGGATVVIETIETEAEGVVPDPPNGGALTLINIIFMSATTCLVPTGNVFAHITI